MFGRAGLQHAEIVPPGKADRPRRQCIGSEADQAGLIDEPNALDLGILVPDGLQGGAEQFGTGDLIPVPAGQQIRDSIGGELVRFEDIQGVLVEDVSVVPHIAREVIQQPHAVVSGKATEPQRRDQHGGDGQQPETAQRQPAPCGAWVLGWHGRHRHYPKIARIFEWRRDPQRATGLVWRLFRYRADICKHIGFCDENRKF